MNIYFINNNNIIIILIFNIKSFNDIIIFT